MAVRLLDDVLAGAGDRTVLCITHRAAEAALFGRVVAMDHGRVVDVEGVRGSIGPIGPEGQTTGGNG
jgi:ABC-type transport system involved in cytochrome bd biosynthesis fused ATPase/permease subunit